MKLIILAAPGAGKGTQAEALSKYYEIPHISTGVILRKNIADKTELGEIAAKYINEGKFVPDDVMIDIVEKRLSEKDCEKGFILDGFPRTRKQAEALSKSDIEIEKVLTIEVDDETIIERLSGRIECKQCGSSYHIEHKKPVVDGVCDNCGGPLSSRADDKPEIIKSRLKTYYEQTAPLKEYYKEQGLLRTVIGKDKIADTTAAVIEALKG